MFLPENSGLLLCNIGGDTFSGAVCAGASAGAEGFPALHRYDRGRSDTRGGDFAEENEATLGWYPENRIPFQRSLCGYEHREIPRKKRFDGGKCPAAPAHPAGSGYLSRQRHA